jgi:hypothetical protein
MGGGVYFWVNNVNVFQIVFIKYNQCTNDNGEIFYLHVFQLQYVVLMKHQIVHYYIDLYGKV